MKTVLCFWQPFNIGDVYMMSLLVRRFCLNNPNETFYWIARYGDVFFEKLPNLKYIHDASNFFKKSERTYKSESEANLWHNTALSAFGNRKHVADLIMADTRIVLINSWVCPAQIAMGEKHLGWMDFDVDYMIKYFNFGIALVNKYYNFNCNIIKKDNLMDEYYNNKVASFIPDQYDEKLALNNKNQERIFVFNFQSHSVGCPIKPLMDYFYQQAKDNPEKLYILSIHDPRLCSLPNVISCDVNFGIHPQMACFNLLELWGVAKNCSNIYTTPVGATWTFLHFLDELKQCTIHMWSPIHPGNGLSTGYYVERLNKVVKIYTDDESSLVKIFNI